MKFLQTNAQKASAYFQSKIKSEVAVSDAEFERIANQTARAWDVRWEWSEDRYTIIFKQHDPRP